MNEDLVIKNLNLIYKVLKDLKMLYLQEEYFDIGVIGLVKAAKGYDDSKDITFSTYAYTVIRNEILYNLKKTTSNKRKANYNTISLNQVLASDGEKDFTLEDVIPSDTDIEEELIKKEELEQLYAALFKLNDKEFKVITYLYGLLGTTELTQKEIAKRFNISQTSIARYKNRAIHRLRYFMEKRR